MLYNNTERLKNGGRESILLPSKSKVGSEVAEYEHISSEYSICGCGLIVGCGSLSGISMNVL